MRKIVAIFITVLFLAALGACTQEQQEDTENAMDQAGKQMKQAGEEVQKTAGKVADWSAERWGEFVKASEEAWKNMQTEWSGLQEDLSEGSKESYSELEENINTAMSELEQNIDKMQDASAEEWQKLKKENEKLMTDINKWIDEMKAKMSDSK